MPFSRDQYFKALSRRLDPKGHPYVCNVEVKTAGVEAEGEALVDAAARNTP